jgi:hypothetical protein
MIQEPGKEFHARLIGAASHWGRGQGNLQSVSQFADDGVAARPRLPSHRKTDAAVVVLGLGFAEGNHPGILYDVRSASSSRRALSSAVRAADS